MVYTDFKGKKIFLQVDTTKGVWTYIGVCDDVIYVGRNIDGVEMYYIEITDIEGKKNGFSSNAIKIIKEEK